MVPEMEDQIGPLSASGRLTFESVDPDNHMSASLALVSLLGRLQQVANGALTWIQKHVMTVVFVLFGDLCSGSLTCGDCR